MVPTTHVVDPFGEPNMSIITHMFMFKSGPCVIYPMKHRVTEL